LRVCLAAEADLLGGSARDGLRDDSAGAGSVLLQQACKTVFHADDCLVLKLGVAVWVFNDLEEGKLEHGVGFAVFAEKLVGLLALRLVH
jgi:hypothetical protein